ncbi:Uncharacterised protein [Serratia proteamaculans]|nr:Uncharacterised protein [Serratia proteamaculans]
MGTGISWKLNKCRYFTTAAMNVEDGRRRVCLLDLRLMYVLGEAETVKISRDLL